MALAPMLKKDGKLTGDFTVANLGKGKWMVLGSGVAEEYHMRWFEKHLPADGSAKVHARGAGLTGLAIAGPNARKLLEKVTGEDVSNAAFPFMPSARCISAWRRRWSAASPIRATSAMNYGSSRNTSAPSSTR
jgi:dimethylglycine dehydrogenase